jgi:hypothetical protein
MSNGTPTDSAGISRPRVGRREIGFVLIGAGALAALTSIPYLVGLALRDPAARFNGVLAFEQDQNFYLANMRQASRGHFLFRNPFTPEPHGHVFFNLEWLVGGWIAALPGSSLEAAFHVLRILGIFGLFLAIYRLSAELFTTETARRVVLIALTTGGGFGWLLLVPGLAARLQRVTFLDTYAGLHPFYWSLLAPHFLLGQVCATFALVQFLRAEAQGSVRPYVSAGLLVTLTGVVRPYDMLVLLGALALYLLAATLAKRERNRDLILRRAVPLLVPIPLLGYQYWLSHAHPVYRWWYVQGTSIPPGPLSLALSLGLLSLFLVFFLGNLGGFEGKPRAHVLAVCAFLAAVGVVYSYPLLKFALQAATALAIPAALVATQRLENTMLSLGRRRAGVALLVGLLLVNAASSVVLLTRALRLIEHGEARTPRGLVAAYRWFDGRAGEHDVVMAALESGNRIPRYSSATSFLGHIFCTVDAPAKARSVQDFYSGTTSDESRLGLIRRFGIRYVFHGGAERALGTWDPARARWLTEVFRNGAAAIYAVKQR